MSKKLLTDTGTPYWQCAPPLGRVFDLALVTWPFCRCGALWIIAAITQESVITRILRHRKLASVPPPSAPARCRRAICSCDSAHDPWRDRVGDVRAAAVHLIP